MALRESAGSFATALVGHHPRYQISARHPGRRSTSDRVGRLITHLPDMFAFRCLSMFSPTRCSPQELRRQAAASSMLPALPLSFQCESRRACRPGPCQCESRRACRPGEPVAPGRVLADPVNLHGPRAVCSQVRSCTEAASRATGFGVLMLGRSGIPLEHSAQN